MNLIMNYLSTISPLIGLQLIIPPLSTFNEVDDKDDKGTLDLSSGSSLLHFLQNQQTRKRKNHNKGNQQPSSWKDYCLSFVLKNYQSSKGEISSKPLLDHKLLTYLFVHQNYHHLTENLFHLFLTGYPLWCEIGSIPFYFIFLGGGVVSQLSFSQNSSIESHQDTTMEATGDDEVDRIELICGSSSAVCSVMGGSCVIGCKLLFHWSVYDKDVTKVLQSNDELMFESLQFATIGSSFYLAFRMLHAAYSYKIEKKKEKCSKSKSEQTPTIMSDLLLLLPPLFSRVAHENHLQGFIFGSSITLATIVYRSFFAPKIDSS